MRPKSALFYLDEIQEISQDFIDYIRIVRKPEKETIEDFLPDIYKFTFESISYIALDIRLGCLKQEMDPELAQIFEATKKFLGRNYVTFFRIIFILIIFK